MSFFRRTKDIISSRINEIEQLRAGKQEALARRLRAKADVEEAKTKRILEIRRQEARITKARTARYNTNSLSISPLPSLTPQKSNKKNKKKRTKTYYGTKDYQDDPLGINRSGY